MAKSDGVARACIAMDDWKVPIFSKILTDHGWKFEEEAGLTADTRHFYVECSKDRLADLHQVVRKCEITARSTKN